MSASSIEIECFGVVGRDGRLELCTDTGYTVGPRSVLEQMYAELPAPRLVAVSIVYEPVGAANGRAKPSRRAASAGPASPAALAASPPAYRSEGQTSAWWSGFRAAQSQDGRSNPYQHSRGGFRNAWNAGWESGAVVR